MKYSVIFSNFLISIYNISMEDYKRESLITGLISFMTMALAYILYIYTKDTPFNYITQTDYSICKFMNNSFCSRTSYLIIALSVYFIYIQINKFLSIPVKNAINDEPNERCDDDDGQFMPEIGGNRMAEMFDARTAFRTTDFTRTCHIAGVKAQLLPSPRDQSRRESEIGAR